MLLTKKDPDKVKVPTDKGSPNELKNQWPTNQVTKTIKD